MEISFDAAKSERNEIERGLPFTLVEQLDWSAALLEEDVRKDYGERRYRALAQGKSTGGENLCPKRLKPALAERSFYPRWRKSLPSMRTLRLTLTIRNGRRRILPRRVRPAMLPQLFSAKGAGEMLKPRGRPRAAHPKERINIRLSHEVVAHFKSSGEGWQTRIDAALREFIAGHPVRR